MSFLKQIMWENTGNWRISRVYDITHETVVTPATYFGILRKCSIKNNRVWWPHLFYFIYLQDRFSTKITRNFIKIWMLEKETVKLPRSSLTSRCITKMNMCTVAASSVFWADFIFFIINLFSKQTTAHSTWCMSNCSPTVI